MKKFINYKDPKTGNTYRIECHTHTLEELSACMSLVTPGIIIVKDASTCELCAYKTTKNIAKKANIKIKNSIQETRVV